MELESLIKLKLEKELWTEIEPFLNDDSVKEIWRDKIKQKINFYTITIDKPKSKCTSKVGQCVARSMGKQYSDIRCSYCATKDSEYCKIHLKRIDEYGYLNFGRYDEPRPIINEKGNKIPWRDTTSMEDINTIIQYQSMNFSKLIKNVQ
jgi:hypothetical protein